MDSSRRKRAEGKAARELGSHSDLTTRVHMLHTPDKCQSTEGARLCEGVTVHKPRVRHQKGLRTEAPDDSGQREDRELGLG